MRTLDAVPLAAFIFVCALVLSAAAIGAGILSDSTMAIWAAAIMASDGELPLSALIAAYPTIPFIANAALELVTPSGTPTPLLVASGLLALLSGIWFRTLRAGSMPTALAAAATLLLALHPMLLTAVLAGPAQMFLAVFLYLFGSALYDLRAQSNVTGVMTVGLALLGIAFSHPSGAAVAIASLPFLALAVRPSLLAASSLGVVLMLAFPSAFAAAAFTYASWIFPGDGQRLFEPKESAQDWLASLEPMVPVGLGAMDALNAGLMIALILTGTAPVALAAGVWMWRRRPLVMPVLVFAAMVPIAAVLAVATDMFGNPSATIVAAPVLAAIVLTRVPLAPSRRVIALLLLMFGWVAGLVGTAAIDPPMTARLGRILHGGSDDTRRADALDLGGALKDRNDVLVDAFNAPALVLGRGYSGGLLLPSSEEFALAVLLSRVDAAFVAVADPRTDTGAADRLNQTFPDLFAHGAPGYRLIYQNQTWRLFARERHEAVYKQ